MYTDTQGVRRSAIAVGDYWWGEMGESGGFWGSKAVNVCPTRRVSQSKNFLETLKYNFL
jgi:hypothetical protein